MQELAGSLGEGERAWYPLFVDSFTLTTIILCKMTLFPVEDAFCDVTCLGHGIRPTHIFECQFRAIDKAFIIANSLQVQLRRIILRATYNSLQCLAVICIVISILTMCFMQFSSMTRYECWRGILLVSNFYPFLATSYNMHAVAMQYNHVCNYSHHQCRACTLNQSKL